MKPGFTRAPGYLAFSFLVQNGIEGALDEDGLRNLQLERLNRSLDRARGRSSYYKAHLPSHHLSDLGQLAELPLMDSGVLRENYHALLCVSSSAVSRIVTLPTSGTSGTPKRMAFSLEDQRETVEYFAAGMRMLVEADEAIAVLYPCSTPGGLGALLCESISLVPAKPIACGIPESFVELAATFKRHEVRGLIGFPQHVFAFARWCEHNSIELDIRGVLLSADGIAASLQKEIARIWDAEVYGHFGMTETAYGGSVECDCHSGYHIRQSDLIFEVIDPDTLEVLPDGEWGELVFTTIATTALPLIRYRTGDFTRLIPGLCPCGSILKRMDTVRGRVRENVRLGNRSFGISDLEDCLFPIRGIIDFEAGYNASFDAGRSTLAITLAALEGMTLEQDCVRSALAQSEVFGELIDSGALRIEERFEVVDDFKPFYGGKRGLLRL